ncbi:MAG TPA: hypothetical protein VN939_13405 [Chthoniobacterales bacterium]|nr:hypothetical protein [Chthoniobacterales bacterium]
MQVHGWQKAMDALLKEAYSVNPNVSKLKELVKQAEFEIFKRYAEISTPDDLAELQRLNAAAREVLTIQNEKLGYPKL